MRRNSFITGLALALTLGSAGVAAAQGVGSPDRPRDSQQAGDDRRGPGGRGGQEAMLLRGITLSADQQAQLKDLGDRQRQQRETERAQGGAARGGNGDARAAREQRRDQHIAAVRALLNADQRVQFDKNVTELKARMAERGREQPDR
jgi:Spy/CpxP family protein refolding chaperone